MTTTTSPLPRLTLILGGARSGKSRYGQSLIAASGATAIYLATATPGDAEMAARIAAHRRQRDSRWRTVEEPLELAAALRHWATPEAAVLVDCLTLWLSNLLAAGRDPAVETARLIDTLAEIPAPAVLIANEVGQEIVPANPLARRFRDDAGFLHQRVAAVADQVVLMVAGLPQILKSPDRSRAP